LLSSSYGRRFNWYEIKKKIPEIPQKREINIFQLAAAVVFGLFIFYWATANYRKLSTIYSLLVKIQPTSQ
jgi:hypothetical protein